MVWWFGGLLKLQAEWESRCGKKPAEPPSASLVAAERAMARGACCTPKPWTGLILVWVIGYYTYLSLYLYMYMHLCVFLCVYLLISVYKKYVGVER